MKESSAIRRVLGLVLVVLVAMLLAAPSLAKHPQETPGVPDADGNAFRNGVVAVSHPLAAEAGAAALEHGGNAIDAAAAIQFALNVVEPQFSGIGGGGFMMIHLAKWNKTFALDCREKAPGAATPTMFGNLNFTQASTSGISVGVPGTLMCVATAVRRWGERSLAHAIQPAIKLAEEGFQINRFLASDIGSFRTTLQPETAALFRPGGVALKEGDLLVQPDLAKTFRMIAKHGPDVFYHGEIGQAIVEAQQRTKAGAAGVGLMTEEDLAAYNVKIREPIIGNYRGYTLASMSPPSSGGLTVIQMLKMLERFPLGDTSQGFGFGATNTLHVMIEAMRLAFADRAVWMGDEDFVPMPKVGLLADPYIDLRSEMISLTSRMPTQPPPSAGDPWPFEKVKKHPHHFTFDKSLSEDHGGYTTHFSVVDKHGNIVAYTTTIEQGWGTGIMVPGYGFLLNNELTDFNMVPTFDAATGNPGANDVDAFKRPRSSMVPTIVLKHGKPFAAYGSPGGSTIINSVLNITLNLIDHDIAIQDAINAPRLSVTSAGGGVTCEGPTPSQPFITPAFPPANLLALRALGHTSVPASGICSASIGSVQAVIIDLQTGKQYGGADGRREGTVVGVPRPEHWWHWGHRDHWDHWDH